MLSPPTKYVLAGLQRLWNRRDAHHRQRRTVDMRVVEDAYAERGPFTVRDALKYLADTAWQWGVSPSELPGGQHVGASGPATFRREWREGCRGQNKQRKKGSPGISCCYRDCCCSGSRRFHPESSLPVCALPRPGPPPPPPPPTPSAGVTPRP
jgi:hypothetical protein